MLQQSRCLTYITYFQSHFSPLYSVWILGQSGSICLSVSLSACLSVCPSVCHMEVFCSSSCLFFHHWQRLHERDSNCETDAGLGVIGKEMILSVRLSSLSICLAPGTLSTNKWVFIRYKQACLCMDAFIRTKHPQTKHFLSCALFLCCSVLFLPPFSLFSFFTSPL